MGANMRNSRLLWMVCRTLIVSAILPERFFPGERALADECSAPSFAAPSPLRAGANVPVRGYRLSVAVGDFNGDGKPDLALANYDTNNVRILLAKGNGEFEGPLTSTVPQSFLQSAVVADFNGDGKPDLAVASIASRDIYVLLGKGDGSFQAAIACGLAYGISYGAFGVGDF